MFAGSTIIEALDLRDGTLVFRSRRDFQVGQTTTLSLAIPPGAGKVTAVEVKVEARRPHSNSSIYTSRVLTDLSGQEFHVHDPALRGAPRARKLTRVMSKDLPKYRGMAVDLSATGAQLEVDEAVEVGKKLQLQLDIDNFHIDKIACQAEVVWCRPAPQGDRFRAGIRFVDNSPLVTGQLQELADSLDERAHSDLHSLLEKAKILGPMQAASTSLRVLPESQSQAPAPPAPPVSPAPGVTLGGPPGPPTGPPSQPLVIPLRASLRAYRRNYASGSLLLTLFGDEGVSQELEFLDCQYLIDAGSTPNRQVWALHSHRTSPLLEQVERRQGHGCWKHYRLVDEERQALLEIISGQCRAST